MPNLPKCLHLAEFQKQQIILALKHLLRNFFCFFLIIHTFAVIYQENISLKHFQEALMYMRYILREHKNGCPIGSLKLHY